MTARIQRIAIALAGPAYDAIIGPGIIASAPQWVRPFAPQNRLFLVTDERVATFQLQGLEQALTRAGLAVETLILPAGEPSKDWAGLQRIVNWLLHHEAERGEGVVALGGGVIGDLAGFAAAITKRGMPLIQIPTTLLAQVDSSVGGKTAINAPEGKNLIGAFHQPALVLIDTDTLATLPLRDLRAGYAEIVKYGLIDDPAFFQWCERHGPDLLAGARPLQTRAIACSVAAKARIIGTDERETSGRRALLNLGHSFGHALEAAAGFDPERLRHGEAVAAGMAMAMRFSVACALAPATDAARLDAHLKATGLPRTAAEAGIEAPGATLVAAMRHDKKRAGGTVTFILMRAIGQAFATREVDMDQLTQFLDQDRPSCD